MHTPEKSSLTLAIVLFSITLPARPAAILMALLLLAPLVIPSLRLRDRTTVRRFIRVLVTLGFATVLMTVINGIFIREGGIVTELGGVSLYSGGISFGIRTGTRLLLMTSALLLFFGSTPLSAITSLLTRLGLSGAIVMAVQLTVQLLGSMPDRISRIYSAQEARGARVRSHMLARFLAFPAILSPLFLSSIVESIERGKSLELRGMRRSFAPAEASTEPLWTPLTILFLLLSGIAVLMPWILPSA